MITKQVQFFGKTASATNCMPLFGSSGTFEKVAGAPAFAEWENGDQIRKFVSKLTKEDRAKNAYVLVNALGAGEYFGSNINADYFPWNALAHEGDDYGYKTFLNAHAFQHHVNKDPSRAFGVPVLSLLNSSMKRVELVIRLDREKAKIEGADGIITRIDKGEFPDVSMGCKVPFDVCYVCNHHSKTKDDYCVHMRPPEDLRHLYGPNKILPNGMRCCVKNTVPRFFDISFVFIGADKTAKVMAKVASQGRACMGDICAIPSLSADVAEKLAFAGDDIVSGGKADKRPASSFNKASLKKGTKVEEEHTSSKALAREIASDHLTEDPKYYEKLKKVHNETQKTASVVGSDCDCGCGTCDSVKVSSIKLGEITKSVPAGTLAMKTLPSLEKDEITISRSALDEMAEHDLGSACSTSAMMGIVLKPQEFQRMVLVRMGEKDLADELDSKRQVFRQSQKFDESIPVDKERFNPELKNLLSSLVSSRSGFGSPIKIRVIQVMMSPKKTLPTETPIEHPLLDKIAEAYNGYRRSILKKLSQAEEVIMNDPQLREAVQGNELVNMFSKTASSPVLTLDSLSYFAGVHLQNRDLLLDTPVDAGVTSQFTNQA